PATVASNTAAIEAKRKEVFADLFDNQEVVSTPVTPAAEDASVEDLFAENEDAETTSTKPVSLYEDLFAEKADASNSGSETPASAVEEDLFAEVMKQQDQTESATTTATDPAEIAEVKANPAAPVSVAEVEDLFAETGNSD